MLSGEFYNDSRDALNWPGFPPSYKIPYSSVSLVLIDPDVQRTGSFKIEFGITTSDALIAKSANTGIGIIYVIEAEWRIYASAN